MGAEIESGMTSSNKVGLYEKLAVAICSAVFQYNGIYEETLSDWFVGLRLIVPELERPRDLIDAFHRLSGNGIIELRRRGFGPYNGGNECFFLGSPFTVILTTSGAIRTRRSHLV